MGQVVRCDVCGGIYDNVEDELVLEVKFKRFAEMKDVWLWVHWKCMPQVIVDKLEER